MSLAEPQSPGIHLEPPIHLSPRPGGKATQVGIIARVPLLRRLTSTSNSIKLHHRSLQGSSPDTNLKINRPLLSSNNSSTSSTSGCGPTSTQIRAPAGRLTTMNRRSSPSSSSSSAESSSESSSLDGSTKPQTTTPQAKNRLSFIRPAALLPSSSPFKSSSKRNAPRSRTTSAERDQTNEEADRPPKSFRNFVMKKMRRKSSQQSNSADPQSQSDLLTAPPTVGVGTRPLDEPNGPGLGDDIGLCTPRDGSDCSSGSENEEVLDQAMGGIPGNRKGHSLGPNDPTLLLPTQARAQPPLGSGGALSTIKGAIVKKIPHSSRSHLSMSTSEDKTKPKGQCGSTENLTGDFQNIQKPKPRKNLGLSRKYKSDYSLRAGVDEVGDVVGLCFVEVNKAQGLPYWKAVTRIGFDMDPFVIISFGEKIFRTRVIRHCLDPVWDEKMFFHVRQHETAYSILFSVFDWDKMSSNDYIGETEVTLTDLIAQNQRKMKLDPETALYEVDEQGKLVGDYMSDFELDIIGSQATSSKNSSKEPSNSSSEDTSNGKLFIRAKFIPYSALRQLFWRKYLEKFDTDESGTISNVEVTSMLDSLGSTLTRETISDFFSRYGKSVDSDGDVLSFEQVICCLESELLKSPEEKRRIDVADEQIGVGQAAAQKSGELPNADTESPERTQSSSSGDLGFVGYGAGDDSLVQPKTNPNPAIEVDDLSSSDIGGDQSSGSKRAKPGGRRLRLEKVVNISRCPICHRQRIGSRMEIDLVTHMAVCASQDWSTLDTILSPGNFVTSSQAHRKWFTKVIGKVQNGQYSLGADSANIIVQDRRTGQLIEEKMQAYVRLGIRLMYKSGGSKDRMQNQRMKKLLKSLTIKQGIKFNSPDSIKEIRPFIAFHGLDLEEVRLPLKEFKTFNEFFYRELKPGSRPIDASNDPSVFVSCADCRLMVFDDLHQSRSVWVKSRQFTLEKLLGSSGSATAPGKQSGQDELLDDKRWALAIFRLAPQDYHRFHAPIDGVVEGIEHISGQYYTVNPMAIRSTIDVYGENVRIVVAIQTEKFGKMYCVFVGAMMVGSIQTCLKVGDRVKKGDDIGYFAFGGSTILTLIKSDKIQWDEDLRTNSSNSIETLVRVGNKVGIADQS